MTAPTSTTPSEPREARARTAARSYTVRPIDLLSAAGLAARAQRLDTAKVDDVVIGCVTQAGEQGACIARFAALQAWGGNSVPGVTLNRFCGSGLEAVNHAAAMVAVRTPRLVVAGGVESMSRVAMGSDGGAIFDPSVPVEGGQRAAGHLRRPHRHAARLHPRPGGSLRAVEPAANAKRAMDARRLRKSIVPVKSRTASPVLAADELPPGGHHGRGARSSSQRSSMLGTSSSSTRSSARRTRRSTASGTCTTRATARASWTARPPCS
jgi:acetyl-CoA C-acetyltransferase